jgi:hypothetical protein
MKKSRFTRTAARLAADRDAVSWIAWRVITLELP